MALSTGTDQPQVVYALLDAKDQLGAHLIILQVQDGVQGLALVFTPQGARAVGEALLKLVAKITERPDLPGPSVKPIDGLMNGHYYAVAYSFDELRATCPFNIQWWSAHNKIAIYLDTEPARRLAQGLIDIAKRIESGIILPQSAKLKMN